METPDTDLVRQAKREHFSGEKHEDEAMNDDAINDLFDYLATLEKRRYEDLRHTVVQQHHERLAELATWRKTMLGQEEEA